MRTTIDNIITEREDKASFAERSYRELVRQNQARNQARARQLKELKDAFNSSTKPSAKASKGFWHTLTSINKNVAVKWAAACVGIATFGTLIMSFLAKDKNV